MTRNQLVYWFSLTLLGVPPLTTSVGAHRYTTVSAVEGAKHAGKESCRLLRPDFLHKAARLWTRQHSCVIWGAVLQRHDDRRECVDVAGDQIYCPLLLSLTFLFCLMNPRDSAESAWRRRKIPRRDELCELAGISHRSLVLKIWLQSKKARLSSENQT